MGAATPHTFFNPSLAQLERQQDSETREMLALRQGTRTCILTEVDRVDGPEIIKRPAGTTPGPVIQMGAFNMQTIDDEFELAAWYAQDRLMAIAGMRGAIGARKMVSIAGWAKHSVLYEFISHEARDKEFIKGLEGQAKDRTGIAFHGWKNSELMAEGGSRGCIRLHNGDVILMYKLLMQGASQVEIVE